MKPPINMEADMKVVVAAAIHNGAVLLVRKNKMWVFPGGKMEKGESEEETLIREMKEELPHFRLKIQKRYGAFASQNSSGEPVRAVVYLVEGTGPITPGREVKESRWVRESWRFKVSPAVRTCVYEFQTKGMLDPAD